MVFSSITFLFFFLPIVLAAYFAVPGIKAKNIVLLIASLFFYAWGEPVYVILMLISIAGNFYIAKYLASARENIDANGIGPVVNKTAKRVLKRCFFYAVAWNIGILFFFKYSNMVIRLINIIPGVSLKELSLGLPIGISFYTFQALSYVIDVYRGNVKPQKSLLAFAMYITMFPQLIAGPIVQYSHIEDRLLVRKTSPAAFGKGVEKFIMGLGKKVILANNIGILFTNAYAMAPEKRTMLLVWLGAVAFTLQIYFDFSGYSDMAIGLGYMLGFRFPVNFDYPYLSVSVQEFWRRWHMTLGSWFREYVYIPLGGSRGGTRMYIRNILIVWALTGLWHGANLNYLLWGIYYGLLLLLERFFIGRFLKQHRTIGHVYMLLFTVFGFVLFSINDLGSMGIWFGQLFGIGTAGICNAETLYVLLTSMILLVLGIVSCTPLPYMGYKMVMKKNRWAAMVILLVIFIVSVAYLVYQSYNPFLYFRF